VGEDGGDGEAPRALDVHEEGAGTGHKGLHIVSIIDRGAGLPTSKRTLSLCLRASAAGLGLRRSTARTFLRIIRQHNAL
jgi:hypothetical protein